MDVFALSLAVAGFISCAEFGLHALLHPIIRRLPAKDYIRVERGPLKTLRRVMPLLVNSLCVSLPLRRGIAERR
jgi:hypothetical protein